MDLAGAPVQDLGGLHPQLPPALEDLEGLLPGRLVLRAGKASPDREELLLPLLHLVYSLAPLLDEAPQGLLEGNRDELHGPLEDA